CTGFAIALPSGNNILTGLPISLLERNGLDLKRRDPYKDCHQKFFSFHYEGTLLATQVLQYRLHEDGYYTLEMLTFTEMN
ncbi:MAG: hypothetical protein AAFS06_22190, partial [Cyanobacteria bacterium J06631_12]